MDAGIVICMPDAARDSDLTSLLEAVLSRDPVNIDAASARLASILGAAETDTDDLAAALSNAADECRNPNVASILVRCLAVPGLVPEHANHVKRHVVSLVERLQPNFLPFLRVDRTQQTFEKYMALEGFHHSMVAIIADLTRDYGDLGSMLAARQNIVGSFSHSVFRTYAGAFHFKAVLPQIEQVLSALAQVASLSETLLSDVQTCQAAIRSATEYLATKCSFLTIAVTDHFLPTAQRLLEAFLSTQRNRFTATIQTTSANTSSLPRKYPLGTSGKTIKLEIPLRNSGQGIATATVVSMAVGTNSIALDYDKATIGNISSGAFSIFVPALVVRKIDSFEIMVELEWGEILSAERKAEVFTFEVLGQRDDLDWDSWEYLNPYNTDVAEGEAFVGRSDQLRRLSAKLLSRPTGSSYITGQKRIGKTSLALAAAQQAKASSDSAKIEQIYILWGNVAHSDPAVSLKRLGVMIDRGIRRLLPFDSKSEPSLYEGSIAALVDVLNLATESLPDVKFVITIDEFDEMPPELFLSGNLAEAFFANLRAISRCSNACLILVGGENMPFVMDRQGQKLNNFARFDLSYFSRAHEYSDFETMVRQPTSSLLNWQDGAISELFNLTNGNPYFTKQIRANVLSNALQERDAEVTSSEVVNSAFTDLDQMGVNSFAHLWQDGIPKRPEERDPEVMRRLRVLVALARCLRKALPATASNIASNKPNTLTADSEFPGILSDFVRRKVLNETDGIYGFVLPIFRMWLVDVGLSQLVANSLSDELAMTALTLENTAAVSAQEVSTLAKSWPTYRGRIVGSDDIRAWLQQVESVFDQRILFKILSRTLVVNESFIRERLQTAHSTVRRSLPEFVIRKKNDRRRDLLITYIDGEGKSGAQYASMYAEENNIAAQSIISPENFADRMQRYESEFGEVKAIVIIDDVVATGTSLSSNLRKFVTANADPIRRCAIRVVSLFSTATGDNQIRATMRELGHSDLEYRSCQVLGELQYAFPKSMQVWADESEEERARALITDLGSTIYRTQPLGFGELGLLLVLPTTVPNNTLPILHTSGKSGSKAGWTPLFPRIVN